MISTKILVVALAAVLIPVSWQHQSAAGKFNQVGFAVAQVPSVNDVWTWTEGDDQETARGPITIAGVLPNRHGRMHATISDISVSATAVVSGVLPTFWWIRDGSTGQILYSSMFSASGLQDARYRRSSEHLSTPVVLDPSTSNSPTIEFGVLLGTPMNTPFSFTCTVVGRYVWNT